MHTGIKMGANASYNGIRFYSDYQMSDGATKLMAINDHASGQGSGHVWVKNILQSDTSLRAPIFYDTAGTTFYADLAATGTSINVAGDVVAYASSDIRFKDNVIPITNALDKIDKINGYSFEWNELSHKETGKKDVGVIAQEVEEILPEIVETRSNGYKAVDYQKLTALLIQSVKELKQEIDQLKKQIKNG